MLTGLDSADVGRLGDALQVLLDPLRGSIEEWAARANSVCARLLRADFASIVHIADGEPLIVTNHFSQTTVQAYPTQLRRGDRRWGLLRRQLRLGVWHRRIEYGLHYDEILRSAYYQDYIVPARAFDAIGCTVGPGGTRNYTSMLFHHDHPTRRRFGPRGMALMRVLFPAFRAGVQSLVRLGSATERLTAHVDDLGVPLLVLESDGRVAHQSPALESLLRADREAAVVVSAASAAARAATAGGHDVARLAISAERSVSTRLASYTVRITRAPRDLTARPVLLAIVGRNGGANTGGISAAALDAANERYGLTPQEARTAALLAERRTNPEIAEALVISPHTARHHTESVLRKLGIHSRKEVPAALRRTEG